MHVHPAPPEQPLPHRPSFARPWRDAAARGTALFLGVFTLFNLARGLAGWGLDANHWWLDLRFLPAEFSHLLLAILGLSLVIRGLRPDPGHRLRRLGSVVCWIATGAAVLNTIHVFARSWADDVDTFPLPFSLGVAAVLS